MKTIKTYLISIAIFSAFTSVNAYAAAVKWNPGHYVRVSNGGNVSANVAKIANNPHFKGVQVVYRWADLEPSKGVYNFKKIEQDLNAARSKGKRLIIQIWDRQFGPKHHTCVPSYLLKEPQAKGGQSIEYKPNGSIKTCTALRWNPYVQDRLIALYTQLGKHFDNEDYVEAISTQENSIGQKGTNRGTYTVASYIAQQKRGMRALADAFPHTIVFKWLNWGRDVGELFDYAYKLGIGVGGPDTVPWKPTDAHRVANSYNGRLPMQASAQSTGALNRHINSGKVTLAKIYDYAMLN